MRAVTDMQCLFLPHSLYVTIEFKGILFILCSAHIIFPSNVGEACSFQTIESLKLRMRAVTDMQCLFLPHSLNEIFE
jgi:hypothetical protein